MPLEATPRCKVDGELLITSSLLGSQYSIYRADGAIHVYTRALADFGAPAVRALPNGDVEFADKVVYRITGVCPDDVRVLHMVLVDWRGDDPPPGKDQVKASGTGSDPALRAVRRKAVFGPDT